jgi:Flp pilus assembly protein TadD
MKLLLAFLAGAVISCGPPDDQRTDSVERSAITNARADWPVGVAEAVDSGNVAYRARDFDTAVRHYRRGIQAGPDVGAAWFGLYMAELANGNAAAADSALEQARALMPGASLLRAGDSLR